MSDGGLCDSTCIIDRGHERAALDWTSFHLELEIVLARVIEHGSCYVILDGVCPQHSFVQLGVESDGSVVVEAPDMVWPRCGADDEPLAAWQVGRLLHLGWQRPTGTLGEPNVEHPLWWREADPRWRVPEVLFTELLIRTLVEVFEVRSPPELRITLGHWNSCLVRSFS